MENIKRKLHENNIPFEENVSLKNKTWIKTGGITELWIAPTSVEQLKKTINIFKSENEEFELVGHTSNLYYIDDYNPSAVVSTIKVKQFEEKENYIECSCGTPVSEVSRYCVSKGYIGFSGLVNLPGTVGAAICNNSGCFECCLSDNLIDCTFYNLDTNKIVHIAPSELNFSYRNSKLKRKELKGVLLSLKLNKKQGDIEEEKAKAIKATRMRKITQETPAYTLGSVFAGLVPKNNLMNFIVMCGGGKILKLSGLYTKKRYVRFLLALYGFYDIKDFVSDKVINTFKWLPNRNDREEKFKRYQKFIQKVYKSPRLEIEIRNGNRQYH